MNLRPFCPLILISSLIYMCCTQADEYRFSRSQRLAVEELLSDSTGWRLARASDNTNPHLQQQLRDDPQYQPYFLETDIDRNGQRDFLITLVRKSDTTFAVFVVRSVNERYASPQLLFCSTYLHRCGLFFLRDRVVVGEFFTDNAVSFQWDSTQQRLVEVGQAPEDL